MRYGVSRKDPSPGGKDSCPTCGSDLIAKCGRVNVWHWAHAKADCDSWSEPITDWHLEWQSAVEPDRREVILGPHRADMALARGRICEVQHSPISLDQVEARESFYDRMIWIIDARGSSIEENNRWYRNNLEYGSFYWKSKRKSNWGFTRDVYLDIGYGEILKFDHFPTGQYETKKFKFIAQIVSKRAFFRGLSGAGKVLRQRESVAFPYYDSETGTVKWRVDSLPSAM